MDKQELGPGFWLIILLAVVHVLLAGCATGPPKTKTLPPPPSEAIRAHLGTVGLLSTSPATNRFFQKPMTRSAAAGRGALAGSLWGLSAGVEAGKGSGDYAGLVTVVVWSFAVPVGALVGSIAGQSEGENKQALDRDDQILHATISGQEIQHFLISELQRCARENAGRQLLLLPGEASPDSAGTINYQRFADCGVDTVMEVEIQKAGLYGYEGMEKSAPLSAFIHVRVRLVRVRDSTELYTHTWLRTGGDRPFADWVQSDGQPLRQELTMMTPPLAENIIEELFLIYVPPTKQSASPAE